MAGHENLVEKWQHCNPMCPVPDLKSDIGKLETGINKLHEKQDRIVELAMSLKFVQEQITELKASQDKLFDRIRIQEKVSVTWGDMVKIVAVVSIISGMIGGSIMFVLRLVKVI